MVSNFPVTPEYTSVSTTSILTRLRLAFLRVSSTALRFMSPAVTKHPCFARWIATTPEPHPTSRTFSSGRTSSDSMRRMLSSDGGYTSSSVAMSIRGS